MKHRSLGIAFVVASSFLGGCPIYSGAGQDTQYRVCNQARCYSCPDVSLSPACVPWTCATDVDCRNGYRCGYDPGYGRTCVATGNSTPAPPACASPADCLTGYACGQDGACHLGDCSGPGCPAGYQCTLTGGLAQCIATSAGSLSGNTDAGAMEAGDGTDASMDGFVDGGH